MHGRRHPAGVTALFVVGTLGLSLCLAPPAIAAPDYPSWSDVQAAKKNEAATKAEIARIQGFIGGLEAAATEYGRVALERGEEYQIASEAFAEASAEAGQLQSEADAAALKATASSQQAGQLIAQLARTSGGSVTLGLMLSGGGAGELLEHLGVMTKLSEQASAIYRQAQLDRNVAQALSDQAAVAQKARKDLADAAKTALSAAESAASEAERKVAAQENSSDLLFDQLASLKGTTAGVERRYREGAAAKAAEEAIKNSPIVPKPTKPSKPGTPSTPGTPTKPVIPGSSPTSTSTALPTPTKPPKPADPGETEQPSPPPKPSTPHAPNAAAVAGAIAFAKQQIGDAYQLGGSGPSRWDCSGLTKAAYGAVGVYIGTHSSNNQYNNMDAADRLVPLGSMVAGDLLFYSSGGSTDGSKYHVAMYIGGGQMIEAPYPGKKVRITAVRYGDLVPYAGRPTP